VVASTVVAAVLVAACSGSKPKAAHLGAAEPAVAPTATSAPAGQSVAVGAAPEGIVYDPVTKLVAVTVRNPDRLVLLDGTTLKIEKEIRLAGHARHLQLAGPGGPVIVPEENANVLGLVALPGGAVTELPTGKSPHDASAVTGGFVAGDEFGGSITIARTGQPEQTVADLTQPGGVVDFGDTVAVVDVGNFTVSTYQVSDGKRIARAAAGAGPTHGIRTSDGRLIVADTRGNQLLNFTENPLSQLGKQSVPGAPYGMASDPSTPRIWVTLTALNQVVGYDVHGADLTEVARLDTVEQPDTVAVDPGSHTLWITGTRAGLVQRLTR
jgi:DNA-binding beta-propeller fold protein YncE